MSKRVIVRADLQFGTLRMMAPLIRRPMTWVASPTDFSSVVLVVLKPISLIITVENELTTPLGIALSRMLGNIINVFHA